MPSRRHRGLVDFALLCAMLAALLGTTAHWVDQDLLAAARWSDTSGRVIAQRPVRRAISGFAVSRAFRAAGIDSALSHALPGAVAGTAERHLRRAASGVAGDVLGSRDGRRSWRDANRQAVAGLNRAVDHPGLHAGVSLQLTPLLADILQAVADTPVARAIPSVSGALALHGVDTGRLRLLTPAEVRDIAPAVRAIRVLSWALPLGALALLVIALLAARGWRAVALSRCGYALAIAGGALLALRALAQYGLADGTVHAATDRAAVHAAWLTGTVALRTDAVFLLVAGGIVAVGSWLVRAILR